VAENQRGGALERRGLGYDAVRALNPRVVYASSQGYGRSGPFGEMPAYGPLNNGFAGLHLLWNHPDAPYPCATGLNHPDHVVGKLLALAVIAALDHRDRTGEGQHLDMAQTEGAAYLLGDVYLDDALGVPRPPLGNTHPHMAPHGVYPAAANGPDDERGGDRWVAISVGDDAAWARFADALGWDDGSFLAANATAADRVAHRDELDARLADWTRTLTGAAAAELLQAAGISAMPVMGPLDQRADPHMTVRGSLVELHHPEVGVEHHVANPLRFRDLPQRTAGSSPCLGADTEDVLVNVLGRSPADVAALIDKGICK
jgi:crotonobetainyl-CoA:carnitine CoA-transferase CaiB-like acyl-CoA transferase